MLKSLSPLSYDRKKLEPMERFANFVCSGTPNDMDPFIDRATLKSDFWVLSY